MSPVGLDRIGRPEIRQPGSNQCSGSGLAGAGGIGELQCIVSAEPDIARSSEVVLYGQTFDRSKVDIIIRGIIFRIRSVKPVNLQHITHFPVESDQF